MRVHAAEHRRGSTGRDIRGLPGHDIALHHAPDAARQRAADGETPAAAAARALKGAIALVDGKKAAGVFGDKGFIGTVYITNPIRKPRFRIGAWEEEWNRHVSSFRDLVERAIADLKAWRVLFNYRCPLATFGITFFAATGLYFFKANFCG